MKKLIAVLLALTALTVSAFASAEPADTEPAEKTEITAALSEEEAVAAALKDAGFAEEDVTVTRTRLREKEDENGAAIKVYTVKFHTEDTTYKYHVNADTGAILDSTVTEGVSEGRSRSGRSASGEMKGAASDEMSGDASGEAAGDDDADTVTSATEKTGRSGKSGRSHKSSSEETDAADLMTDVTNA